MLWYMMCKRNFTVEYYSQDFIFHIIIIIIIIIIIKRGRECKAEIEWYTSH